MIHRISLRHLIMFLIFGSLTACSNLPRGVAPGATLIGLADSGRLVRLHPTQQLVVQLEANVTTGYQWEIDKNIDRSVLLADGSKFNKTQGQRDQDDEVSEQYLRFVAQQPGRTRLELVYVQPKVGNVDDSPRYNVDVIVVPKPDETKQD
jgi:predicted secreted protein